MKNLENIDTERLMLKTVVIEDAPFFLELYNSPSFIEFIGDRNLKSVEDAENYVRNRFFPQIEKLGYGNYLVIRKEDGAKIGAVGIFERDGLDVHDIGFSFLEEFHGKGYGFEAASKLLKKAFTDFGCSKISAITSKENVASQTLIKKLGLQYLKMVKLPEESVELLYYEIEKP